MLTSDRKSSRCGLTIIPSVCEQLDELNTFPIGNGSPELKKKLSLVCAHVPSDIRISG